VVSLSSITRFTVGHTFVRPQFYTFGSERGDQAALCGGSGPADIHPFHWPTTGKGGYSRDGLFPV